MLVAPQGLWRRIDRDGPAVGSAHFVDTAAEIPNDQIGLHLEVGHHPLEVLFTALAKTCGLFALEGEPLVFNGEAVHDPLAAL